VVSQELSQNLRTVRLETLPSVLSVLVEHAVERGTAYDLATGATAVAGIDHG